MAGGGFADETGEVLAAVVPVLFGPFVVQVRVVRARVVRVRVVRACVVGAEVLFVEVVVLGVEDPAAVDAGEEVFEEVAGGAPGVEGVRRRPVSSGSVSSSSV